MSIFGDIWQALQDVLQSSLEGIHGAIVGLFGVASWGWAILLLTLGVRILMLPLASKQFKSMRAMQQLQPKVKSIQKKHKVDRELMRKDPEKYRKKKQQMNEEMMALYKEHGVNPASGCLPLILQMPIFFALFTVLRNFEPLANAPFYFFTSGISAATDAAGDPLPTGLGASPLAAGPAAWSLIILIAASMYFTQKQMMARRTATDDPQATQQQKIMLYVMPIFLGAISVNLPMGVLLYWVMSNLWQFAQQAIIMREVQTHPGDSTSTDAAAKKPRRGPDGGEADRTPPRKPKPKPERPARPEPAPTTKPRSRRDHLPGGRRSGS